MLDRLIESDLDEGAVDLVLAALDGESTLAEVLSGEPARPRPDLAAPRVSPSGAFLTRLTVQGFRGIGTQTVLTLPAGPGLTVIAGRNGSGKSSLSEAMECALTGSTKRWSNSAGPAEFRRGWRNLHSGHPCEIALTLHQEGQGEATIRVCWPPDATEASAATITYQVPGHRREHTGLGWDAALQTYRPLLSYDDLGLLLRARPSELHDSIALALGLDELDVAVELLRRTSAPLKAPLKRAGEHRKALRDELNGVDDDRARQAAGLLSKTSPDMNALTALLAGDVGAKGPLQTCRQIRAVVAPSADQVEAAVWELESASAALAELGERRARADELRDQLLIEALEFRAAVGGEEACPVCGVGALDAAWKQRTEAALHETDLLRHARSDAERRLQRAEHSVRQLVLGAPAVLEQTELDLSGQARLNDAWRAWADTPMSAEQLRTSHRQLIEALADWQQQAEAYASTAAERWAPYAVRLAQLVEEFTTASQQAAQAATLDAAYAAATAIAEQLRAERLNPIKDQTKRIWNQLKQESNVTIDDIELIGKANRRAVDIKAVVDDASGSSALSVMSQGELNSLALALYLPRATSDDSPFRFLVLDDPVQAMDPTKVDGLAGVLAELSQTHQVIVFTHDDRFAQAARRLPTPPTVLCVERRSGSQVIVRSELRPSARHLDDAYAMLQERNVPDEVKRRVLPGILRQAIEEAAWTRYVGEQLQRGERLERVEQTWQDAARTRARLTLLFGETLKGWQSRDQRRERSLAVCNTGAHGSMTGDPRGAYDDAKAVVQAIEGRSR